MGVIKESSVKKYNKSDYPKIGKGFAVIVSKDGKKSLFVDSFSNEDQVGYVIFNKIMIESLLEVFENVYQNIKNRKIEVYK